MSNSQLITWDLNLNGDTFNAMKSDFNAILRKTLYGMETKESETAEVTVKVKISFEKTKMPLEEGVSREIIVPKFEHKVSSVMQYKSELTGSLEGEYELHWDKERGEYVMREILDPQMSFDDIEYPMPSKNNGDIVQEAAEDDGDTPALTGAKVAGLLPDKSGDDEGCMKDFPDCQCLGCMRHGEEHEEGSCCYRHKRDCRDADGCPDYANSYTCETAYEYDEPEIEEEAADETK